MRLDEFDYELPEELIAQEPLPERSASRMMLIDRQTGGIEHRQFQELGSFLCPGDLLVLNDAKVIPARLLGRKVESGGKVELVLTMPLAGPSGDRWRCIGQASKAIRPGMKLDFDGLKAEVLASLGDGSYEVRFETENLAQELERVGRIPLPPYIKREISPADRERYQTVFAARPGAAAAPTAGFHFTEQMLQALKEKGVSIAHVTLYVGAGTFLPVRTEHVEEHRMHPERYEVSAEAALAVEETKARGGRVVAVGTTALRALESAAQGSLVRAGEGTSQLFIYPGFRFQVVDALVTNFHLPRSTLLLLVSAFAGKELILRAYREAVAQRYRFFSYGDAMFLR